MELSAQLEMLRLGAMKTLNIVNLVQSIQQHNTLNIVWNSGFTALNLFLTSILFNGMTRKHAKNEVIDFDDVSVFL
jgi:hypothetical protein